MTDRRRPVGDRPTDRPAATDRRPTTGWKDIPETPVTMCFLATWRPCESGKSPNPSGSYPLPIYGTCSEGSSPLLSNQITIPSPYLLSRLFFMPLSPFTMIQNHNNNSYSLPIMLHPIPSNPLQRKHRHRRNVTSHHFKSFLFNFFPLLCLFQLL